MYQNTVFDPSRELRLWDDTGMLPGFSRLQEPAGVLMQVHPRLRGSSVVLEDEMLDWAARQIRVVYGERVDKELWTRVPEDESLCSASSSSAAASSGIRTTSQDASGGRRPDTAT
jgi:hypothetical protein